VPGLGDEISAVGSPFPPSSTKHFAEACSVCSRLHDVHAIDQILQYGKSQAAPVRTELKMIWKAANREQFSRRGTVAVHLVYIVFVNIGVNDACPVCSKPRV